MPPRETLTSADNPRVKAVVRLHEHKERRKTGVFLAQGEREVERALAANLRAAEVFWCPAMLGTAAGRIENIIPGLDPSQVPVTEINETLLRKMSSIENPRGILAVFEQPRWSLADLLPGQPNSLFLVAVGTEKPGNLGAMVRSADAAGVAGVLVADGVVDAFNPSAIRAGTCAVFTMPLVGGTSEAILSALRKARVKIHAAAPDAKMAYTDADWSGAVALVIGAEDVGLSAEWLKAAEESGASLSIPMRGRTVDSLNASVAAGVMLFEALRQRGSQGH